MTAPSDPAVALRENQCRCGKADRNDFDLEVLGHTCYCPGCAATTPWFPTQALARASWAAMQRPERVLAVNPPPTCESRGHLRGPGGKCVFCAMPLSHSRPNGSNADEWASYLENWLGHVQGINFVAVQIAEAIDTARTASAAGAAP